MHKKALLDNISKIHTTEMGIKRIKKNLEIDDDVVKYGIDKIKKENSIVSKKGKNYYVDVDDCIITVNSSSFTIITCHKK